MAADVWIGVAAVQCLLLLSAAFVGVGCVNLDKPSEVQMCSATGTCSDDPIKAPTVDANRNADTAVADLTHDQNSTGRDAGEVKGGPYLSPDMAAPDFGKDMTVEGAAPLAGPEAKDATVVEDVVPEDSPAAKPGPEQPGAEPPTGPELGPEPSMGPEPGPESAKEPGLEPAPEPSQDGGSSDSPQSNNCTIFYGSNPTKGAAGQPPAVDTLGAFCLATCDDIDGWGCSNFDGRTISVNGTTVSCGASVTKKNGYYVFRASAGRLSYASIYWWGPAASACPAPPGGIFP
jgi:hypothetical protein